MSKGFTLTETLVVSAIALILFAILLPAFMVGCSISSGVVTQKEIVPAHYEMEVINYISVDSATIPIYGNVWKPTKYMLRLKNGDKEGWREVSELDYNNYNIGGYYGVERH